MPPPTTGLEAEARYFGLTELADDLAVLPPSQGQHAIMRATRTNVELPSCVFCACVKSAPIEPMDGIDLTDVLRSFTMRLSVEHREDFQKALREATTDGWILIHACNTDIRNMDMILTFHKGNASTTC